MKTVTKNAIVEEMQSMIAEMSADEEVSLVMLYKKTNDVTVSMKLVTARADAVTINEILDDIYTLIKGDAGAQENDTVH